MLATVKEVRTKGSYKIWSKAQRNRSSRLTTRAEKLGWIRKREKCERCGKTEGIIHLHCEDYSVTLEILTICFNRVPVSITEEEKKAVNAVLEVLCFRCHLKHHTQYNQVEPKTSSTNN